jgi:periplasmic protein TonB
VHPLLYALNIGTLATWITVSGASTVAVTIKVHERLPKLNESKPAEVELAFIDEEMGSAPPAAPEDAALTEEDLPQEELPEPEEIPELPEVPEIPELAELEPLPDIPELPMKADGEIKPKPQPAVAKRATSDQPKQATRKQPTARRSGPSGGGTGEGAGTARGSGNSQMGGDRWAKLKRRPLRYPEACRRAKQEGTVLVSISFDERGYVVNTRIVRASAYALLNDAALANARTFSVPPGPRGTKTQSFTFKLNN